MTPYLIVLASSLVVLAANLTILVIQIKDARRQRGEKRSVDNSAEGEGFYITCSDGSTVHDWQPESESPPRDRCTKCGMTIDAPSFNGSRVEREGVSK
jgi:hypothetical protein